MNFFISLILLTPLLKLRIAIGSRKRSNLNANTEIASSTSPSRNDLITPDSVVRAGCIIPSMNAACPQVTHATISLIYCQGKVPLGTAALDMAFLNFGPYSGAAFRICSHVMS